MTTRCQGCGPVADGRPSAAVIQSVVGELRGLAEEWDSVWPDGRVCKAELHRIADRLVVTVPCRLCGSPSPWTPQQVRDLQMRSVLCIPCLNDRDDDA